MLYLCYIDKKLKKLYIIVQHLYSMAKTQRINITLPAELRTKIDESPYGLTGTIVKALERFFELSENTNKGIEERLEARIESLERQLGAKDNQIKKLENILENQSESLRQLLNRSQEGTLIESKSEDLLGFKFRMKLTYMW